MDISKGGHNLNIEGEGGKGAWMDGWAKRRMHTTFTELDREFLKKCKYFDSSLFAYLNMRNFLNLLM